VDRLDRATLKRAVSPSTESRAMDQIQCPHPMPVSLHSAGSLQWFLFLFLVVWAWPNSGASLNVEVVPRFDNAKEPLTFDLLSHRIAAGDRVSFSRVDLVLSGFSVRQRSGQWRELSNQFAFLSLREGRTKFALEGIPPGAYDRFRFHIGVPQELNHANPAIHPPGHTLNPAVNGMHWNWQGGYVFAAIEGGWVPHVATGADKAARGYAWHLATDALLSTVELPITVDLEHPAKLRLGLDLGLLFRGKYLIRLTDESTSTHSRPGDTLAIQLMENLRNSFSVEEGLRWVGTPALAEMDPRARKAAAPLVAPDATAFQLTFSAFFPEPQLPLDNPLTEQGVELGRRLFHEPLLSQRNNQSCASCHQLDTGFVDAGKRFSEGSLGHLGTRNSMPLFNLAWRTAFFWDGRARSLREQVLQPIENPAEMGESLIRVVAKLEASRTPGYALAFQKAFGSPEITADRIARALEQFLLAQVSWESRFDQSLSGQAELTKEERRGMELFHTEYDPRQGHRGADCFHCHGGPLFMSQGFANNGLDEELSAVDSTGSIASRGRDIGRASVTGKAADRGRFAVPSLRNVALTAPYMHDGRFQTLEQVVDHYASGVKRSSSLDPNLSKHPESGLILSAEDKSALVAFLRTLTDVRYVPDKGFSGLGKPPMKVDESGHDSQEGLTLR
jgi:cytochrome c peroxidase